MSYKHPLLSICTTLFLLCAFVAVATAAPLDSPLVRTAVDQAKTEAATLMSQGKVTEAYELYSRLLREEPDDDEINLGLARSALAASRPNQALMAYLRLLEKYPNEAVLNKEVAQTYMALGDKKKAELYLTRDPSLNVADRDNALENMDKRYDRFQVHGNVRTGILFDSNANQGTSSNTMELGDFRVDIANAKRKETFGGYLGGQLELGYRLEQAGAWWVVGDVQAYARGNTNNDLGENTSRYWQWGRVAAGARFLDSQNLFDLRLKSEIFDYEFDQHVLAAGPEFFYVRGLRPWVQLVSRGGVELRDYNQTRDNNGTYWTAGEYARFFFGEKNHEFMIGGRYLGADANNNNYSYNAWEASALFNFKLPYGFQLTPSISYGEEYYKGPATSLETEKRKDERLRTGLGLAYAIDENWSIETSYQYTNNNSRSSIYDYDQHLTSLGVSWSF